MRNLLLVFKNGIKRSFLLIPAVLLMTGILAFAFMGGRSMADKYEVTGIPIGVIDKDKSVVSADMIRYMEERLCVQVTLADAALSDEEAFDEMSRKLIDCNVTVILEIPKGLEEGLLSGEIKSLEMTILDDYANEAYTKSYLNSYLERTKILAGAAAGDADKLEQLLTEAADAGTKVEVRDGTGADMEKEMDKNGLSLMLGFFTFVGFGYPMFMGMLIQEDKRNGTFRRIQVSSVKPVVYIGGMALGNLAISGLTVFGVLAFLGTRGLQSSISLWLVGVLMFTFVLFSIGFNLMAAFLAKNGFVYMTIGISFISITNILGGLTSP